MIEGLPSCGVTLRRTKACGLAAAETGGTESPPAEVLEALDVAARVLDELAEHQVEISLAVDAGLGSDRPRIHVELSGPGGDAACEISQRRLLDLLEGDTGVGDSA